MRRRRQARWTRSARRPARERRALGAGALGLVRRALTLLALRLAPAAVLARSADSGLRGLAGEALAARALRRAGWRVLARRLVTRAGEADLVARDAEGRLVLVEVKTSRLARIPRPAGCALETLPSLRPRRRVGPRARERLWRRARALGAERVELVEVLLDPARPPARVERRVLARPGD